MNNPMEILQMMTNIKNPKEYAMSLIGQNNDPIVKNLIQMAEKNDTKGIEKFATNLFKEQGMNFQEIMKFFK